MCPSISPLSAAISSASESCSASICRDLARQHYPQPRAHLVAQRAVALRLRRLPLQRSHLLRDFLENVVHPRQVLLRLLQPQFGQTLLRFEARNSGSLFDNRAPVMRLRAQQLPDALLADDRVGLRPQTGAHEDVLNIAQPAQLPVQQIFAVAGAEQPPRNHNLATLRGALELAPANLQHHFVPSAVQRQPRPAFQPRLAIQHLSRLRLGDDLLGLRRLRRANFFFVPVAARPLASRS